MQQQIKSIAVGIASGLVTCGISIYTLAYTHAWAMPQDFSLALWDAAVVFGLGAMLVALLVHLIAILTLATTALPALAGFAGSVILAAAATGQLAFAGKAIAAWLIGALMASAIQRQLKSRA